MANLSENSVLLCSSQDRGSNLIGPEERGPIEIIGMTCCLEWTNHNKVIKIVFYFSFFLC